VSEVEYFKRAGGFVKVHLKSRWQGGLLKYFSPSKINQMAL
jgi:hypothetical protein